MTEYIQVKKNMFKKPSWTEEGNCIKFRIDDCILCTINILTKIDIDVHIPIIMTKAEKETINSLKEKGIEKSYKSLFLQAPNEQIAKKLCEDIYRRFIGAIASNRKPY